MRIFLDSVDINSISRWAEVGVIVGVTTNPSLAAKSSIPYPDLIKAIAPLVKESVSAQVVSTNYEDMVAEANSLVDISDKVAIKLPLTENGLRLCSHLADRGVMVNMTLCFSPLQALLAVEAGASYVSLFVGRLEDNNHDVSKILHQSSQVVYGSAYNADLLVASIRKLDHILLASEAGAGVITIPESLLPEMLSHPLTDAGLDKFLSDWKQSGKQP